MRLRRTLFLLAVSGWAFSCGVAADSGWARTRNPCDFTLHVGKRWQSPPQQFHVNLVFVLDPYDSACRVSGFPEVELIGPVDPLFGALYELPDQRGRRASLVLRAGESAHAVLTWLPPSLSGDRWVPGYLRVVVPTNRGPSLPMAVPWRFGRVLRQDAATHPGTYVGPLRPGPG